MSLRDVIGFILLIVGGTFGPAQASIDDACRAGVIGR
jgi:hypothetical protein